MSNRFDENNDYEELVLLPGKYNDEHGSRHSKDSVVSFRHIIASCAAFSVSFAVTLLFFMVIIAPTQIQDLSVIPLEIDAYEGDSYVLGPPTESFRDNLRDDVKYITSWLNSGWTNDVMTLGNLIYLAMLTERVPILPRFLPTHVGGDQPYIPFSEVFDIPRLSRTLRMPILEWDQVKDLNSTTVDELGCWAVWPTIAYNDNTPPRGSRNIPALKLGRRLFDVDHSAQLTVPDISYTVAPSWVKLAPPSGAHGSLWSFARLSFPEGRAEAMGRPPIPSPQNQVSLPPDDHLLCYDYLYFASADRPFEWERDYSPAWRFVGKHMHWNGALQKLADDYVERALGVEDNGPTPPYIAVHARRGDFSVHCKDRPIDECLPTLSVIARHVAEVQEELLERKGINVTRVLMASDEQDPGWWAEVRDFGWSWVDYAAEGTVEKYGKWYPVLLDAVLLSGGAGFIGTEHSTFSFVALRRVQYWNDGAVRTMKISRPGADDH
ncbi:hypothetical protein ID866_8483 [Astraeus odoratus]|nr:hypothetical protein ID866_8483 [Astraeus odoratus]